MVCVRMCTPKHTRIHSKKYTRSIDEAQSRCVSRCEYLQDGKWKGSVDLGLIQPGLAWLGLVWLGLPWLLGVLGRWNFSGAGNASSAAAKKFPAQKLCQVKQRTAAWRVEAIEEV